MTSFCRRTLAEVRPQLSSLFVFLSQVRMNCCLPLSFRVDFVSRLSYFAARPSLEPRTLQVFILFFLPDRPTHHHKRQGDGKRNILLGWPNLYFRQTVILSVSVSLFLSLSLSLSLSFYYFPYTLFFSLSFFVLNLSYPSRMCILFCLHIWAELSFLSWTFMSGTFFRWGVCTFSPPPPLLLRTRLDKATPVIIALSHAHTARS